MSKLDKRQKPAAVVYKPLEELVTQAGSMTKAAKLLGYRGHYKVRSMLEIGATDPEKMLIRAALVKMGKSSKGAAE